MGAASDPSRRLLRLEQIVADSKAVFVTGGEDADPAQVHLGSVPIDRIRQLTAELQHQDDSNDKIDAVTIRLLLNDYATAVAHLRAVAHAAEERIATVAMAVDEARQFVRRELKLQEAARRAQEQASFESRTIEQAADAAEN